MFLCCLQVYDKKKNLAIRMSYVVPSGDGLPSRRRGTTRSIRPSLRSAYLHSFSTESKTSFLNTSRWSRIVQTFLSTSTLHGVSHLRPPCSRRKKCFWLFAILSCGTFFLVHASVLIYNAFTRPSLSTTLTLKYRDLDGPLLNKYDNITKFPGITVCGITPFKRQKSEDFETFNNYSKAMYYALSLGYPYSGLTLEQRIRLHEMANKTDARNNSSLPIYQDNIRYFNRENTPQKYYGIDQEYISEVLWNNSYSCSEVFSQCTVGYKVRDCCSIFTPVLTTYGYCYSLQIDKDSLGVLEMETLPFIFDLHVPPSKTTDSEEGYLLLVHDPRFTPRMILPKDGLLVAPGVTMSLRLTLRITDYSAKYAKWFGLVSDCPNVACMEEDYSIQECVFQNAASKIRDVCNCSWILDECRSGSSTDVPICGPEDMIGCVIKKANRILTNLLKKCQPPCLELDFDAVTSYAQLRYNYSLQDRSRIAISYNTISYYHNIYHKHYLSSLFSDIGGAMGLLLGASCLTGIELLMFLGQWIYFTFFNK